MNNYQKVWAALYVFSLVAWMIVLWYPNLPSESYPIFGVFFVAEVVLSFALGVVYKLRGN